MREDEYSFRHSPFLWISCWAATLISKTAIIMAQLTGEAPLHSPKLNVWCIICADQNHWTVFLPKPSRQTRHNKWAASSWHDSRFFAANNRRTRHLTFLVPVAHVMKDNNDFLKPLFPDQLISNQGDFDCPARSPDLKSPYFFLWGHLKSKNYNNKPRC